MINYKLKGIFRLPFNFFYSFNPGTSLKKSSSLFSKTNDIHLP